MRVMILYSVRGGELCADYPLIECPPRRRVQLGSRKRNQIYDLFAQGVLTVAEIAQRFDVPERAIRSIGFKSALAISRAQHGKT